MWQNVGNRRTSRQKEAVIKGPKHISPSNAELNTTRLIPYSTLIIYCGW